MKKTIKVECVPRPLMAEKILLLEGFTRAGKFFLGKVCDGFDLCEHFQYVPLIEQIPPMVQLGLVKPEAGIALMRLALDESAYSLRIGRNLNLRYMDSSSLYKNVQIDEYLKRCFAQDGPVVAEDFKSSPRYCVFIGHELMANMNIAFDAFPSMQVLSLQRHPVDLVYSWWKRKMGQRETTDPLSFNPYYKVGKTQLPWFSLGLQRDYDRMKPLDRVIETIDHLVKISRARYRALPLGLRRKILFLTHECLIEDPWKVIARIEPFLGVKPLAQMPLILAREKCGRTLPVEDRERKWREIRCHACPASVQKLESQVGWYEQKFAGGVGTYA